MKTRLFIFQKGKVNQLKRGKYNMIEITKDVGKKYSIIVKHRPPVKGNSSNVNKIRKEVLREEAAKQLDYSKPKWTNVKMKVHYYNGEGRDDVLNVEGGIADALQGIAYSNDKQIRSSSMDEYFLAKDPPWYKVDLEFLHPGLMSHDGEFQE